MNTSDLIEPYKSALTVVLSYINNSIPKSHFDDAADICDQIIMAMSDQTFGGAIAGSLLSNSSLPIELANLLTNGPNNDGLLADGITKKLLGNEPNIGSVIASDLSNRDLTSFIETAIDYNFPLPSLIADDIANSLNSWLRNLR
jgi:hypothetical protein